MKLRLSFLVVMLVLAFVTKAQDEVDVSKLLADTKTFIFDDSKSTVKDYIYSSLETNTSCCGSDRIYLEVKIDPSGYVLQVKSLTGKNDCFKQSAADIVKNIRWNAQGFKGPKSVYFEIKPNISCNGDRPNTYVAVPIVNNELLAEDGTKLYSKGKPMGDGPTTEEASSATEESDSKEVSAQDDGSNDANAGANTTTPQADAEVKEVVASTEVVDEPQTTTAEQPSFTEPVASEDDSEALNEAKAASQAADEELTRLKEQMAEMKKAREEEIAEMKAQEELKRRKIEARRERARKIRERREQLAQEKAEAANDDYFADGDDDDDDATEGMNEDQRLADEVRRLQEQRQQLQGERNAADDARRRASEDHSRYGRDIFRIEEEIKRIEEERMRAREQAELARLEEERRRVEEEKRSQEDQLQRLMDEIQRLKDESDSRLAEITRQGQDINDLQQEKVSLEDRIETERIKREQQTMAELRMRELELQSQIVGAGPSPDFSQFVQADSDSSRMLALLNQIALLQTELNRVSAQVGATGQPGASNPAANTQPASGTAATDDSWKDTEFKDPNAPEGTYNNAPKPGPKPTPTSSGSGNSTVTTMGHGNSSGPTFANLEYGQGSEPMKLYITDKLREGGVCGLAQTFCEVTVNPEGKVAGYKILRANSPLVMALMPAILQSLDFKPDNIKFTQISYIELKADLYCGDEKVDLKAVQPYVKPGN